MENCRIFIYKSQISRFKLVDIISNIINFKDFRHNKYYSTGVLETCIINIRGKSVEIIFLQNEDLSIMYDIKNELIKKLNAESIYFQFGENKEIINLEKYNPKLINRVRYKLVKWLKY